MMTKKLIKSDIGRDVNINLLFQWMVVVIFRDIHRNDESHGHDLATAVFVVPKSMQFESTVSIFRRSSRTSRKDELFLLRSLGSQD